MQRSSKTIDCVMNCWSFFCLGRRRITQGACLIDTAVATSPHAIHKELTVQRYLIVCLLAVLLGACASSPAPGGTTPKNMPTPPAGLTLAQLRERAEQGDMDAEYQLGSLYFLATPKDLKQAAYWWKRAADHGQAMAAVSIAYLYTGQTDASYTNEPDMLKYLQQAAVQNNAMAQHMLGAFYLTGEHGLPRDPDQSKRLYQSACDKGFEKSCETLKTLP